MAQQRGVWVLVYEKFESETARVALKDIRYELVEGGKIFICFGQQGIVVKHTDFEEACGERGLRQAVAKLLNAAILEVRPLDGRGQEAMVRISSMVPVKLLAEPDRIGEPAPSHGR